MIALYQFLIAPLILWVILFLLARNRGTREFSTLFFVCVGITVISLVASIYLPDFAIIIVPVASVLLIQKFCYIGWVRSIVAAILYFVVLAFGSALFERIVR